MNSFPSPSLLHPPLHGLLPEQPVQLLPSPPPTKQNEGSSFPEQVFLLLQLLIPTQTYQADIEQLQTRSSCHLLGWTIDSCKLGSCLGNHKLLETAVKESSLSLSSAGCVDRREGVAAVHRGLEMVEEDAGFWRLELIAGVC